MDDQVDPACGPVEKEKKPRQGGGAPRHDASSGLVEYKDGQWGVDIFLHGRRHRRKIGKKSAARKVRDDLKAAERMGAVALPKKVEKRTLAQWIDEYCKIATSTKRLPEVGEGEGAPRWATTNAGFAGRWAKSHGKLYPEQFTLEMLRDWCHDRLRAGAEIATVQRAMDPLRAVYAEIQRTGAITEAENPFRDRKALKLPVRNKKKAPVYLPLAMRGTLAAAFGPVYWRYAVFAICTLMRFENQRSLRWDNIDWQGKCANLTMTKNGQAFQVQLTTLTLDLLRQQLAWQEENGSSEWCFPNSRGGQLDKDHFRERVWAPAFVKCGLKVEKGGRNGMTWHALGRHTGATWLMQAGEDAFVVKHVMNHEDLETTMIYSHHSDDARRQAMDRLSAILLGPTNDPRDRGSNAAVTKSKGVKKSKRDKKQNSITVRFSTN